MINKVKQFIDRGKLKGIIEITVKDKDGNLKQLFNQNFLGKFLLKVFGWDFKIPFLFGHYADSLKIVNTITNTGKAESINLLGNVSTPAAFTYLAVGTGTTAAAATDTALQTEIVDSGLARAAATVTRVTTTVTNDTLQLVKQWTATGAKVVTEAGAFNAASTGIILGRQVFSAVSLANTDTFQLTYKFVQA